MLSLYKNLVVDVSWGYYMGSLYALYDISKYYTTFLKMIKTHREMNEEELPSCKIKTTKK